MKQHTRLALIGLSSIIILLGSLAGCRRQIENMIIDILSTDYQTEDAVEGGLRPKYTEAAADRPRVPITLAKITTVFQPTDIQFPPDGRPVMLISEKNGKLNWFDLRRGEGGVLAELKVMTRSEQGLLGIAFHPAFADSSRTAPLWNTAPP